LGFLLMYFQTDSFCTIFWHFFKVSHRLFLKTVGSFSILTKLLPE
jgi:hypothetical protein